MENNTNRHELLLFLIFIIYFSFAVPLSHAQNLNPNFRIEYKNNLLSISAQKADIKNVLLKLSDKTGVSFKFPNSLKQQITIKLSGQSLRDALSRILKGLNHAIVYSGSRKNRAAISEVLVYRKSIKSKTPSRSIRREKQIADRIRSYEKRIESVKKKLLGVNKNSRQGRRYLRQISSYENIIRNLNKKLP